MFKVKEGLLIGGKQVTGEGPTEVLTAMDVGAMAFRNNITPSDLTVGAFSYRNKLINGNMDVWQRTTSLTAIAGYSADRWYQYASGGTLVVSRSTDVPNAESLYSIQFAGSAVTGGAALLQDIEPIYSRSLVGKRVTVSFWAKQTAGTSTLQLGIQYFNAYDNVSARTTIETSSAITLTSSWAKYTVTFSSVMPAGVANGIHFYFIKSADPDTSTWLITQVQLEEGPSATSFEHLPPALNLLNCRRYYYRNSSSASNPYEYYDNATWGLSATAAVMMLQLPTTMRVYPTLGYGLDTNKIIVANAGGSVAAVTSMALNTIDWDKVSIQVAVASGLTANTYYHIMASNSANTYMELKAEYF